MKILKPKPIDWTKYIEPIFQDFETKNGLTTAIFLNKENYAIRKDSRCKNTGNNSVES